MSTTTEQAPTGGTKLADLAGDFGASAPERAHEPAGTRTREDTEPDQRTQPEPAEDAGQSGAGEDTPPRRRPRPAPEHLEHASSVAAGGIGALTVPTLAEVIEDEGDAICEFQSLWWRVPRAVYAIVFVIVWIGAVSTLKVLARVRYALTATLLIGGVWAVWALWGAGL